VKTPPPLKHPVSVAHLLKSRLQETKRTSKELAEAIDLPKTYVDDLLAGKRRPPLPARTDIYERMTTFLRLGRNELALCARAERAAGPPSAPLTSNTEVVEQLMELCEPETAKRLRQKRSANRDVELADLIQRLLDVAQGAVRRLLDDEIGLRIAASREGSTYPVMRLRVLEFLDATPDTLTEPDMVEFVRPRVENWSVDLDTGVLKVVLRAQWPNQRDRRRPATRATISRQ